MQRPRGFNLMEVLISVGILSVALLGVMSVYYWGTQATEQGERMTQAINYARDLLETIRVQNMAFANGSAYPALPSAPPLGIADATTTARDGLNDPPFNGAGVFSVPSGTAFTRNIQVAALGTTVPSYQANVYVITVSVFWTHQGSEKSVTLTGYATSK